MRLNENLVNLLKDLEGRVDEADKKVINEALQDVRILFLSNMLNSRRRKNSLTSALI